MSLIFVKRDITNKNITIFSDGREMDGSGLFIENEYTQKVEKINKSTLIAVCGSSLFKDRLIIAFKNDFDFSAFKNSEGFLRRTMISDFVEKQMLSFKEEKLNNEDYPNLAAIIVINDEIYACERFNNGISTDLIFEDNYALGLGDEAARILLECNFEPQEILNKMSKFYVGINNNLFWKTIDI